MDFALALAIAVILNLIVFVVAFLKQSDKFTDLTYAATFILIAAAVISLCSAQPVSWILLTIISLWAVRLGAYLGIRIHKIGRDKRFDSMRPSFWRFGRFWVLQGLSVWVIMVPSIYLLQNPDKEISPWIGIGLAIWLVGFVLETVADWQKWLFKNNRKNNGKWIDEGVWSYSRHPNYLGEILVWLGIYLVALPYLSAWEPLIALVSPIWITLLLVFITGLPAAEKSADNKWGKDPDYRAYKKRVPVLVPKLWVPLNRNHHD